MGRRASFRPLERGSGAVNCGTGTKNNSRLSFALSTAARFVFTSALPLRIRAAAAAVSESTPSHLQKFRRGSCSPLPCERAPDFAALVCRASPYAVSGRSHAPIRSHDNSFPRFVYHHHATSEARGVEGKKEKEREKNPEGTAA